MRYRLESSVIPLGSLVGWASTIALVSCSSGQFEASSRSSEEVGEDAVGTGSSGSEDAQKGELGENAAASPGPSGAEPQVLPGTLDAGLVTEEEKKDGRPGVLVADVVTSDDGYSEIFQSSSGLTEVVFRYGPEGSLVDFVFVYDNSVSMKAVLPAVKTGFLSLTSADWPQKTRVAFMTTMPGDPKDLSRVHAEVAEYNGIALEPGFLSFVEAASVARFVNGVPSKADSYSDPVCQDAWFAPADTNGAGKPCLSVAFQNPFTATQVEAGLTSFGQILDKSPGLFRRGANVHVVFVSDTNDPGRSRDVESLLNLRPRFADLEKRAAANSEIVGLRLHGITPGEGCNTGEGKASASDGIRGLSYKTAIEASKGVWLDICDGSGFRDDFRPVAEQILKGSLPEPVFLLPFEATELIKLQVDGQPYPLEKASLSDDGKSVRIKGLSPTKDVNVSIQFE